MHKSIVVVGSCIIDFTCYVPRFPKPGETVAGTKFEKTCGGKGANQCVTAAKLGAKTTLIGSLGSDEFAEDYLQKLIKLQINTSYIKLKNTHTGIGQILVAENGENNIVNVTGANGLLSVKDIQEASEIIRNSAVLLCEFEVPLECTLEALKLHKGHGISIVNGAPAKANPDPMILQLCDIFCVNETEAEIMTGIAPITLDNAQNAIDVLLSKGCNTVILTLGAIGAVFASREDKKMILIPTRDVNAVDTSGAGDAFLGALGYFKAYYSHLTMAECIRRACFVASESVTQYGTQDSSPTREMLPPELFL